MKIETVVGLAFGVLCAVLGVVFRPFWLSPVGPYVFLLFIWITTSLAMGWGGKGKPYSFRFGVACGTGLVITFAITMFVNLYVSVAVFCALLWIGIKSKFFLRRSDELKRA
ncbi:hypothetical protein QO002_001795 [Pararhizobium capsulatum DSM 1112]|uniref:Uncharacterized protein n=1 Tax=Pararhizobium capsulatum DSM 1112 TaxID=1121113 RepID=A0ABU0BRZ7_9HYPH|nr:hypothetical protein [Pararhizobium capsulatum]MDQ0319657.1 hypothetical protein [Pararhizobium capsulatum DSM 1112]